MHALRDVTLEVREGELVGLIGPNGAGKTTLVDAVSGFADCAGRVELSGADIGGLPPYERARRGLGRTWQSTELSDDLDVRENLKERTPPDRLVKGQRGRYARRAACQQPWRSDQRWPGRMP